MLTNASSVGVRFVNTVEKNLTSGEKKLTAVTSAHWLRETEQRNVQLFLSSENRG